MFSVKAVPGRNGWRKNRNGYGQKDFSQRRDLLGLLTRLGFSLLLWEEHERLLKEFVARMILAGEAFRIHGGADRDSMEIRRTVQESATSF